MAPILLTYRSSRPHGTSWSLYGVFFVKGVPQGSYPFSSSVSLFDPKAPFPRPDHAMDKSPTRAGAVRAGRFGGHRRLGLDGSEHVGTLRCVGMTIGGEPACRARIDRAASLYSVGLETRTMMQ